MRKITLESMIEQPQVETELIDVMPIDDSVEDITFIADTIDESYLVMESLIEAAQAVKHHPTQPSIRYAAESMMEKARVVTGLKPKISLSMEDASAEGSKGIVDTILSYIRQIWNAIKAAFKKIVAFFVSLWNKLTGKEAELKRKTAQAMERARKEEIEKLNTELFKVKVNQVLASDALNDAKGIVIKRSMKRSSNGIIRQLAINKEALSSTNSLDQLFRSGGTSPLDILEKTAEIKKLLIKYIDQSLTVNQLDAILTYGVTRERDYPWKEALENLMIGCKAVIPVNKNSALIGLFSKTRHEDERTVAYVSHYTGEAHSDYSVERSFDMQKPSDFLVFKSNSNEKMEAKHPYDTDISYILDDIIEPSRAVGIIDIFALNLIGKSEAIQEVLKISSVAVDKYLAEVESKLKSHGSNDADRPYNISYFSKGLISGAGGVSQSVNAMVKLVTYSASEVIRVKSTLLDYVHMCISIREQLNEEWRKVNELAAEVKHLGQQRHEITIMLHNLHQEHNTV